MKSVKGIGDWGLGIGDWGVGIGDWAQSPLPNPQSPIPNPQLLLLLNMNFDSKKDAEYCKNTTNNKYIILYKKQL